MTTGTKSLLFGVHQFIWHPITVARGWRRLYGKWPSFWESVAIFVHDWGYWGCEKMDDAKGEQHPVFGAVLVAQLYAWCRACCFWKRYDERRAFWREIELFRLAKYHSRYLSAADEVEPSKLCWADKMSPVFDPPWFYLLRARLSGELAEYRLNHANADQPNSPVKTDRQWYDWLRRKCELDAKQRRPASHRRRHCAVAQ